MSSARAVRWGLAALTSIVVWGTATVPASATVVDTGRYAEDFAFGYADCGFPVDVAGRVAASYRIREGTGADDSAYFLRETFSFREVHTNGDSGKWFVLYGTGVFNEIGATQVEGSIFEFTSIDAGQPFVVENSSGEVVLRDRGLLRKRLLFDTSGDNEPGGTEIGYVGFEVAGPHPGLSADFCQLASDLIG
jgi:hypothetical protein